MNEQSIVYHGRTLTSFDELEAAIYTDGTPEERNIIEFCAPYVDRIAEADDNLGRLDLLEDEVQQLRSALDEIGCIAERNL